MKEGWQEYFQFMIMSVNAARIGSVCRKVLTWLEQTKSVAKHGVNWGRIFLFAISAEKF